MTLSLFKPTFKVNQDAKEKEAAQQHSLSLNSVGSKLAKNSLERDF